MQMQSDWRYTRSLMQLDASTVSHLASYACQAVLSKSADGVHIGDTCVFTRCRLQCARTTMLPLLRGDHGWCQYSRHAFPPAHASLRSVHTPGLQRPYPLHVGKAHNSHNSLSLDHPPRQLISRSDGALNHPAGASLGLPQRLAMQWARGSGRTRLSVTAAHSAAQWPQRPSKERILDFCFELEENCSQFRESDETKISRWRQRSLYFQASLTRFARSNNVRPVRFVN